MNKDYHKQQLQALAANCRKLGLKAVEMAIGQAMEQVNDNIYWRTHSYDSLKGFLEHCQRVPYQHLLSVINYGVMKLLTKNATLLLFNSLNIILKTNYLRKVI